MGKPKTKVEKLFKLLKEKFDIDCHDFERQYCGHWQRSEGGWSWACYYNSGVGTAGSCESVTYLLRKDVEIKFDGYEITGQEILQ